MKRIGRGIRRVAGRMNDLELRYQKYLSEQQRAGYVVKFAFEAIKLRLADKTSWTPDFYVMRPDGLIEFHDTKGTTSKKTAKGRVKGPWIEQHANIKMKVAAEMYPFRFFAVWLDGGVWQYQEYGSCPAT